VADPNQNLASDFLPTIPSPFASMARSYNDVLWGFDTEQPIRAYLTGRGLE
jgi:hypothetical protein